MRRERTEVDRKYEIFLANHKRRDPFLLTDRNDFQAEYESIYGTPEAVAEWDRMNRLYRERYEREHA